VIHAWQGACSEYEDCIRYINGERVARRSVSSHLLVFILIRVYLYAEAEQITEEMSDTCAYLKGNKLSAEHTC